MDISNRDEKVTDWQDKSVAGTGSMQKQWEKDLSNKLPFKERLAFRQAKLALVLGFVIGLVVSVTQISIDYMDKLSFIDAAVKRVVQTSTASAANALWNLDETQAESVLDGLFSSSIVSEVHLKSSSGDFLVSKVRAQNNQTDNQWWVDMLFGTNELHVLPIHHEQNFDDAPIGELQIKVDPYDEAMKFASRSAMIFLLGILRNLVLAFLLVYVFYGSLTKPVLEVIGFLTRINPKKHISEELSLSSRSVGELGVLVNSLNLMISELNHGMEERRRSRQHIENLNRDLEKKVIQRTKALQEEKLRADKANEAKSEFLAMMSHDLRTPLNAILGYAQLLKDDSNLNEGQLKSLTTIEQSGNHLLTLINDILDVSKIEAGKLELYPHSVDLNAFLGVVADIARIKAQQKGLKFIEETSSDLPKMVSFDEKRMRQVLLNLLGNAIKFTDKGQIAFRVYPTPEGGKTNGRHGQLVELVFEVQDTGVGMTEDHLKKIFQPFTQVGDIDRRGAGTGLGLAISRQLVELMDSRIQVKSRVGKGSFFRFKVEFPVVEMKPVEIQGEQITKVATIPTGYEGERRRILVVDDFAQNRDILMDMLSPLGFEFTQAANGLEAKDAVQDSPPDMVLMDLFMPVMDGIEATRHIRALPGGDVIPIVIISAMGLPENEQKCMSAGANAFLTKPIDKRLLVTHIGEMLNLTWTDSKAKADDKVKSINGSETNDVKMAIPPSDMLEELRRLAQVGNMGNLKGYAKDIEALDNQYAPFVGTLSTLADNYESKAILALIESNLKVSQHG